MLNLLFLFHGVTTLLRSPQLGFSSLREDIAYLLLCVAVALLGLIVGLHVIWAIAAHRRGWAAVAVVIYFVLLEGCWNATVIENRDSIMSIPDLSTTELRALRESGRLRGSAWSRWIPGVAGALQWIILVAALVLCLPL